MGIVLVFITMVIVLVLITMGIVLVLIAMDIVLMLDVEHQRKSISQHIYILSGASTNELNTLINVTLKDNILM